MITLHKQPRHRLTYMLYAALCMVMLTVSCNDYETYGDKKAKERKAIDRLISDSAFTIISESQFHLQGDSTSVEKREFVYMDNTGVYMQIMRRGSGDYIQDGENINLLCRFIEMNVEDTVLTALNAYYYVFDVDRMFVNRTGNTYTASFLGGKMYETYGASVPAGWLVPLNYIKIGRRQDQLAKVRLIVPHTQGNTTATSYVYPFYYEITFQRER